MCSTDILAFHAKDGHDPRYLGHLVASHHVTGYAARTAIGTKMPRTSWAALAEYPVLAPPSDEQRKIGEILSAVDAAIERTRAVIDQTRRLKSALLQDLLTHGLPGKHTETHDVALVGSIPTDWPVRTLGTVVTFLDEQRVPVKEEDRLKMRGQFPYYGASGIIDWVNDYIFDEPLVLLAEDGENIRSRALPAAFVVDGKV